MFGKKKNSNLVSIGYKVAKVKLYPSEMQKSKLYLAFRDANRIYKYIVDNSITNSASIKYLRRKHLGSQFAQGLVQKFEFALKSQKGLKTANLATGKITFKRVTVLPHWSDQPIKIKKFIGSNAGKLRIQNIKGDIRFRGAKQFGKFDQLADHWKIVAVQLKQQFNPVSGKYDYYVHFVTELFLTPENYKKYENRKRLYRLWLGLDFGSSTALTFSDGTKIDYRYQHTEAIKRLSTALNRKLLTETRHKRSARFRRIKRRLQQNWIKLMNQRQNTLNHIKHLLSRFNIATQDDNIHAWAKLRSLSSKLQDRALGKLKAFIKDQTESILLDSNNPTSKVCCNCGNYNSSLTLSDRTYQCSACGVSIDRDVNAAINMLKFAGIQPQLYGHVPQFLKSKLSKVPGIEII